MPVEIISLEEARRARAEGHKQIAIRQRKRYYTAIALRAADEPVMWAAGYIFLQVASYTIIQSFISFRRWWLW